ncbi:hypothetical protein Acr_00g0082380 [Actinidia rufa]|uniref:Uncharacterized protein n=1 Tax=Actinidia rufa TaxID=165716 RepID=A0A7J0DUK2_9ERIC|nr:hypothetical protein Acr_00g0082380 [Actinidia rufa]
MANENKVLLSPGFIANYVPVYERERMENIRRNNEVCRSLGVKRITPYSIGLVQHKRSTTKAKRTKRSNGELDDVDYRPQDDDYNHDVSDTSDSFEQEVHHRDATRRTTAKFISRATMRDNVMSNRVTRSTPQSDMDSQSLLPPITQPQREHAAQMASKIGMEVRTHVMDLGVHRWKVVDDIVKVPILQRLTDKIEQIEVEQNLQDGAIPITQEELFIKVFGRRSGYVIGLGMRPSSSSKSIDGHGDNKGWQQEVDMSAIL